MFFDFCVSDAPVTLEDIRLDTIFYIHGDKNYRTPHKGLVPGKTYFLYTLQGEGCVLYDGKKRTAVADTFLFMQPRETFSYWCEGEEWEFWWFEFTGDCRWKPDKLFQFRGNHLVKALLTNSLQYAKSGQWEIASSLFLSLLRVLSHGADQSGKLADRELLIGAAEAYIRKNIGQVTVQELAEAMGMEQRTLRNLFYRIVSMSPKQFITQIRLDMAGYLLTCSTLSLEEIACQLGFSSQYHLSKAFKAHFAVTPIRYRKYIIGSSAKAEDAD